MPHNAVSGSLDTSIYSIPCKLFPKFNISETGRALDIKKKKKKKAYTCQRIREIEINEKLKSIRKIFLGTLNGGTFTGGGMEGVDVMVKWCEIIINC